MAIIPIQVRDRYFVKGDERFFIRGVVYQVDGILDPISDDRLPQLEQDVALFQELGLNTIFVYSIDRAKSHARAMQLLMAAGIYVYATITTPSTCIHRANPSASYNPTTMAAFFEVVDIMATFPNTLGLAISSSLINNEASTSTAPALKAVAKDLEKYMRLKNQATGQRVLPISYDAATCNERDRMVLDYFLFSEEERCIDFWTCKDYHSLVVPNRSRPDHAEMLSRFQNIAIPIFLSEYGDPSHRPRSFRETYALHSNPDVSEIFSGGCVYEFWQSFNAYGIVELLPRDSRLESAAHQAALARAEDSSVVAEKRDTERGTLLVYHEFVNFREALRETKGLERGLARMDAVGSRAERDAELWAWREKYPELESCVDWARLGL